jgi:ATP-dependent Lhr-like helicase
MQFTMKADPETFFRVLGEEIRQEIDPLELVYPKELPLFDKYDEYLPEELVRKGFAHGVLDIEGMRDRVLGWAGASSVRSGRTIPFADGEGLLGPVPRGGVGRLKE